MAHSPSLPVKHSHWFPRSPEAEIVVRAGVHFYTTKALLSRVSTVFRDMLEIGAAHENGAAADSPNGKRQRLETFAAPSSSVAVARPRAGTEPSPDSAVNIPVASPSRPSSPRGFPGVTPSVVHADAAGQETVLDGLPLVNLPDTARGISLLLRMYSHDPVKMPDLEGGKFAFGELLHLFDVAAKYEAHLALQHVVMVLRYTLVASRMFKENTPPADSSQLIPLIRTRPPGALPPETLALYPRARMFDKKTLADLCADKLIKHNPNDWPAEGVARLTKEDLLLLVRRYLPAKALSSQLALWIADAAAPSSCSLVQEVRPGLLALMLLDRHFLGTHTVPCAFQTRPHSSALVHQRIRCHRLVGCKTHIDVGPLAFQGV